MKNIIVIILVIAGLGFYISNKDPFPKTVYFSGEKYTLGEDTGKKGKAKTYQYTKSGNINGLNDFVHIFVIDKSSGLFESVKDFQIDSYNLKPLNYANGKFGVFRVSSEQREYFAYSIERETASSQWLLTFVNQSNFGGNSIGSVEARQKADEYFSSLDSVFNETI